MTRISHIALILIVLISCSFFILSACSMAFSTPPEGKYCLDGRDTIIQFGKDCRYAILAGYEDKEIGHLTSLIGDLYDQKQKEPVLSPIYSYQETDDSVFMVSMDEVVWFQKKHNKLVRRVNPENLTSEQKEIVKTLRDKAKKTVEKAKQESVHAS